MTTPAFIWPTMQATPSIPTIDTGGNGDYPMYDPNLPDDADSGEWDTPDTIAPVYGQGMRQQPIQKPKAPILTRLAQGTEAAAKGTYEFGKQFLKDMNIFEPGISGRETLFRTANDLAFLLPPVKLGMTAGLGIRVAAKALETGAVSAGLSAIRGTPIVPSGLAGAGIGGALEALITKGRRMYLGGKTAAATQAFENAGQDFSNIAKTPLNSHDWGIVSAQRTDEAKLRLPDQVNATRHVQVGQELENLGYKPVEVDGYGPNQQLDQVEKAWLVPGLRRRDALEISKAYGQGSVLTNEGLFDLEKNVLHPRKQTSMAFDANVDKQSMYWTDTPYGSFAQGFDAPISISNKTAVPPTGTEAQLESTIYRPDKEPLMDRVLNMPVKATLNTWYTKLVRSFKGIEDFESMMGPAGQDRADKLTAANLAQLVPAWSGYAEKAFNYGITAWHDRSQITGPALKDIFARVMPGEWATFERYGFAKRFIHLHDNYEFSLPNGLTREGLGQFVSDVEKNQPHLNTIFNDVQGWRNEFLKQTMLESGILSKDAFNAITNESKDFVPLRRPGELSIFDTMTGANKKAVIPNPVGRRQGIQSELEPWTHALIDDLYSWSRIAHKQDVADALIGKFNELDDSALGLYADRLNILPPEMSATHMKAIESLRQSDPELAAAAEKTGLELRDILGPSRAHAEGYLGGWRSVPGFRDHEGKFYSQDEAQRILNRAKSGLDSEAVDLILGTDEHPGLVPGTDNKRIWYKLKDPLLMEAFNAMKPAEMGVFTKLAAGMSRVLRAGATLSFEFMMRNPIKDAPHAYVTTGTTPNNILKGFAHAFKQDEMYQLFMGAGGGRASMVGLDRVTQRAHINDAIGVNERSGIGKLYNVMKTPYHALQALSDVLETGTRVGVFEQEYKRLLNGDMKPAEAIRRAALASRNATVDFGVHGSRSQTVRLITAFWNAQIQGYDNLARSFARDPKGATVRALATITLPSTLLYLMNRDDEEYHQLPSWERDMFWHVKTPNGLPWAGDKWMRFPKPFDLGYVFGSAPERFMQFMDGTDRSALDRLAGNYISKNVGDLAPVPTALRPIIENFANYSFLRNRPIESRALEDVAPEYRVQPGTSEFASALGKHLGVSPIKIDNLVRGYVGGLGKLATDAGDAVVNLHDGNFPLKSGVDPRNVPGLRGFFSQFPLQSESVDKMYQFADNIREAEYTKSNLRNSLQLDDYMDWSTRKAMLIGMSPLMRVQLARVKQLRSARDMILRDKTMSSLERAEQLDAVSRAMLDISSATEPLQEIAKDEPNR